MYIFFFSLIVINSIFFIKLKSISEYLNIFDKKTEISLLGGSIIYLNFFLTFLFIIYNPDHYLLDSYFKEFYPDQKKISVREVFLFFFLPTSFFLLGLYDDKYNLTANYRIIVSFLLIIFFLLIDSKFIISKLVFFNNYEINLNQLSIIFTAICVVGLVFSLNMFDGINLQSALFYMTIFIYFIFKGVLIYFSILFLILLILFFVNNYRNNLYLGDSGIYFLASLISIILLKNYNIGVLKLEEIIILFLIPITDMIRVCVNRIFRGCHPFKKDQRHLHHIIKNYTHNAIIIQCATILTIINIILFKILANPFVVIFFGLFFYSLIVIFFKYNQKK